MEPEILATLKNGDSQQIQIRKTEYHGTEYIDIRKFYLDKKDDSFKPTRKGISLTPEQWEQVKAKI